MLRSLVGSEMCIRDRGANTRTDTFWTLALVQAAWQTILGLACFCMLVKGLKYTRNVPIMCSIGNTFAHAMVPVGVLLLVVFFLLFGFAVVFHIKLAVAQMDSFSSLGASLFSVFRGLLGDIDTDGIVAASPTFGPMLYCLYVTVVLFVGNASHLSLRELTSVDSFHDPDRLDLRVLLCRDAPDPS
eukprot:TRINITY_DN1612_c1_g1_i6.p1 TRINITY_DN1612_c1_g1~~TRINITY_DN1612_c1_g1_i6.p1  ORF type:complete len:186 (-),score=41.27 TRINITY_DN1612_c1_g1_i6:422-979(-)